MVKLTIHYYGGLSKAYEKREGVKLDVDAIIPNPGKRAVMKQILNALWGKLAQNENNCVVSFIDDFEQLFLLSNDSSVEVISLDFLTDKLARTTHRKKSSNISMLKDCNVVIAAFVTAYARLELFNIIHKLGKRVLYYDTDFIIYISCIGMPDIETGEFLGDLTDELNCGRPPNVSGKWIEEFCSSSPKSYAYKTNLYSVTDNEGKVMHKRDSVVHAKGFSLKGDRQITFDSISSRVWDSEKIITVTYKDSICRDKQQKVFVQDTSKKFQFTFDKHVVLPNFFTVPYGYCR